MQDYSVFLYGLLGGASFEFLRWRSLLLKGDGAQFKRLIFVAFSIAFALLAGLAATAFTKAFVAGAYRPVVAFVAGAGFEKLVQLAADLKIWRPDVPLGDGDYLPTQRRQTLLAFMRG